MTGGRSCVLSSTAGSWLIAWPSAVQRRVCSAVTVNRESYSPSAARNVSSARRIVSGRSNGLVLCVWT